VIKIVTPEKIKKLRQINAKRYSSGDIEEISKLDFQFHKESLLIAENHTIIGVYGMMQPIIEKLMEVGKKSRGRELTFREHENIIDASKSQDRIAYSFFTSNHLDRGLEFINENLSNHEADL
jgi:DNA-binding FadR family transcriptional regulator